MTCTFQTVKQQKGFSDVHKRAWNILTDRIDDVCAAFSNQPKMHKTHINPNFLQISETTLAMYWRKGTKVYSSDGESKFRVVKIMIYKLLVTGIFIPLSDKTEGFSCPSTRVRIPCFNMNWIWKLFPDPHRRNLSHDLTCVRNNFRRRPNIHLYFLECTFSKMPRDWIETLENKIKSKSLFTKTLIRLRLLGGRDQEKGS